MFYLLLAICSSAMVSIVMRLSEQRVTNPLGMLLMNYCMCTMLSAGTAGFQGLFDPSDPQLAVTTALGCIKGVLYLTAFILLKVNIRRNGVVLSSTFSKLGLLVTMVVSVCVYREIPSSVQTVGFVMLLIAIVMINYRKGGESAGFKIGLIWQMLCGGMGDAMSKIFERTGIQGMDGQFLFFTFCTALVLCAICLIVKKQRVGLWELVFGLMIGLPNFFSTKFLLRALEQVSAVIVYPVWSVSVILVVTLAGVLVFRERLAKHQWVAMGIILTALALLNM